VAEGCVLAEVKWGRLLSVKIAGKIKGRKNRETGAENVNLCKSLIKGGWQEVGGDKGKTACKLRGEGGRPGEQWGSLSLSHNFWGGDKKEKSSKRLGKAASNQG